MISLKKCGISDDPEQYYLADVTDSERSIERELASDEIPYNLPPKSHGILRLYIRYELDLIRTFVTFNFSPDPVTQNSTQRAYC